MSIDEAIQEVDDTLRQDHYALKVRRGTLNLDEASLGSRSKRPGCTPVWLVTSDAKDPHNADKLMSEFEMSFLFKRRRALEDLKVLPDTEMVNPCAALARASQGFHRIEQGPEV